MASIDSRRANCCMSNAMGWLGSRPQPEPEREPERKPIDGREMLAGCLNHKQRRRKRRKRKRQKQKQKQKQERGIQMKTSQGKNPAAGSPRPVGIRSRSCSSKWEDYAGYFFAINGQSPAPGPRISTCHSFSLSHSHSHSHFSHA